jgi:acyl-CoA synthetase (AMP-forming)/AMP-acid ligase II
MNPAHSNMTFPLSDRVLSSAKKYPDRPALELPDRSYTYRELIEAATTIEQSIIDKGEENPFIAVQADKSFDCYASILGILMAGNLPPGLPGNQRGYRFHIRMLARILIIC